MPSLFIEETNTGNVNKSGYLYVGRKHKDEEVIWIKLKWYDKNTTKDQGGDSTSK